MKKEYIVELSEEEADELMDKHWVGEIVRCADCHHANISPSGLIKCQGIFRSAGWFCADGEREEGRRSE